MITNLIKELKYIAKSIIKESLEKLKEDNLGNKKDYTNFLSTIKNDNMGSNMYVVNDTTYINNCYEISENILNYIILLFSNITDIPKESVLLKKDQKIKLYDLYSFVENADESIIKNFKKDYPEYKQLPGKYFVLEILNDNNYTKLDLMYIIDLKNAINLFQFISKYKVKISNILLNDIKKNLNKYDIKSFDKEINKNKSDDEENYEKLNTSYKYDRKNIGKVILTKFDKDWGKFAPKKFLIYDNSFFKPINMNKIITVSQNKLKSRNLNFYGFENKNTPIFYVFFDENDKPKYREDKIFAVIIKGFLSKNTMAIKEEYNMDFMFDLIIEKNTDDGNKYYSISYIDTIQNYNSYKITSYKDYIETNKNIMSLIKDTTKLIVNNKL